MGNFGGPVVKTLLSNAWGMGSIPGSELRSYIPHGKNKNKNRSWERKEGKEKNRRKTGRREVSDY